MWDNGTRLLGGVRRRMSFEWYSTTRSSERQEGNTHWRELLRCRVLFVGQCWCYRCIGGKLSFDSKYTFGFGFFWPVSGCSILYSAIVSNSLKRIHWTILVHCSIRAAFWCHDNIWIVEWLAPRASVLWWLLILLWIRHAYQAMLCYIYWVLDFRVCTSNRYSNIYPRPQRELSKTGYPTSKYSVSCGKMKFIVNREGKSQKHTDTDSGARY
jgi:hypothetical protein